jgi:ABC-type sulfate transport system permease subunit
MKKDKGRMKEITKKTKNKKHFNISKLSPLFLVPVFFISDVANAGVITDAPTFQKIGTGILNFLLSIAGIVAIISLVVSGILYFFSFGNETRMETAKKSAKYSVLGIILVSGSMVVIRMITQLFPGN